MEEEIKKPKRGRKKKDVSDAVETENVAFENMTVTQYFNLIKGMKNETDSTSVKNMLEICEGMLKRFEVTGQTEAAKKAVMTAKLLRKELELFDRGVTQWVHIDDVTKYYHSMTDENRRPLKLIEIHNFPRLIPENIVDRWLEVKDLFDVGYVLFTDYTEKTEKQDTAASTMGKTSTQKEVEKKRKEKDPILFGAIRVDSTRTSMESNTYEKLYFIGDWIDEYCDLTFDKLVERLTEDEKTVGVIKPIETAEDFKSEAGL